MNLEKAFKSSDNILLCLEGIINDFENGITDKENTIDFSGELVLYALKLSDNRPTKELLIDFMRWMNIEGGFPRKIGEDIQDKVRMYINYLDKK